MSHGLAPDPSIAYRKIEGRYFVIDPAAGRLHLLNEVGTLVWELLDGQRTEEDIALVLIEEYEVTAAEAEEDVRAFLESLRERGLVRAESEGRA